MHLYRRLLLVVSLGSLALIFAGCETVGERMRDKFGPAPSRVQLYEADQSRTYEAATAVVGQLGFRVLRGGAAQGRIDAVSALRTDDAFRGSRQLDMKIRLNPTLDGGTEVRVTLTELIQDDYNKSSGMGMAVPLRDMPVYAVFFRRLGQALGEEEKN